MEKQKPRRKDNKSVNTSNSNVTANTTKGEYTASELVYIARLKKIEREHKSIGASLDKRVLHKIEDAKLPSSGSALGNRRDDIIVSPKANNQDRQTESGTKGDSVNKSANVEVNDELNKKQPIVPIDDFDNEELIWKTKASSANYSVKRKFNTPELQEFFDELPIEQRETFQRRCRDMVVQISIGLRNEMNKMKEDMNGSSVFHSEANTHRAHCLYLTKLYKAIKSENIEDPVLRSMRSDITSKKQADLVEKQRLRDHWNINDIGGRSAPSTKEKKRGFHLETVQESRGSDNRNRSKSMAAVSRHSSITKGKKVLSALEKPTKAASLSLSKSLPQFNSKSQLLTNNNTNHSPQQQQQQHIFNNANTNTSGKIPPASKGIVANLNNNNHRVHASANGGSGAASSDDVSVSRNSVSTTSQTSSAVNNASKDANNNVHFSNVKDKILFTKMKKGRMATYDPKKLLPEEAARLERGESTEISKDSKRSTLLHVQAAEAVLERLQNECIFSTVGGNSDIAASEVDVSSYFPTKSWKDIPGLDVPIHITTDSLAGRFSPTTTAVLIDTMGSSDGGKDSTSHIRNAQTMTMSLNIDDEWRKKDEEEELQAQRVVSYGDFQQMFQEYTAEATAAMNETFNNSKKEEEVIPPFLSITRTDSTPQVSSSQIAGKVVSAAVLPKHATALPSISGSGGSSSATVPTSAAKPPLAVSIADAVESNSRPFTGSPSSTQKVEPVDIVAALKTKDSKFNDFIKVTMKDKGNKMITTKSNATTLTQPRKLRLNPPVGLNALDLSNIRSLRNHNGFKNVFKDPSLEEEHDDDEDEDEDEKVIAASVSMFEGEDGATDEDEEDEFGRKKKSGRLQFEDEDADAGKRSRKLARQRSRSRNGKRERRGTDNQEGGLGGSQLEETSPLQEKICAVHDALQLPTLSRINFMFKYSSSLYSRELALAVDVWAEAAILIICRNEVCKLLKKLQYGYCVLPLHHTVLFTAIHDEIPPVLINNSEEYVTKIDPAALREANLFPISRKITTDSSVTVINEHHSRSIQKNESFDSVAFNLQNASRDIASPALVEGTPVTPAYRGYAQVRALIRNAFLMSESTGEDEYDPSDEAWDETEGLLVHEDDEPGEGTATEKQLHANLVWINSQIEKFILGVLKRANDEFDDVICFGNVTCREWLKSTAIQTQRDKVITKKNDRFIK